MKETLNEEQLKQAAKEAGGFCFCIFKVTGIKIGDSKKGVQNETLTTHVEAERFFDAKAFGSRLMGISEVDLERAASEDDPRIFPRWQVRWEGHAAGSNTLHMQARLVESESKSTKWRPIRELSNDGKLVFAEPR